MASNWPDQAPGESIGAYAERAQRENWAARFGPYQSSTLAADAPDWQRMGFGDRESWARIYRKQEFANNNIAPAKPAPTPAPAPLPPQLSPQGQNALVRLRAIFKQYDLSDASLEEWAKGLLIKDKSEDEIMLEFYDQPVVDRRFPGIKIRRQKGLAPISPGQYLEYEQRARQIFSQAGIPTGFYDGVDDFTKFIADDVALPELETRINDGWRRVASAPPLVREAFAQYFGPTGDSALAAWFLDKEKAEPILEQQVMAAEVGGTGMRYGVGLDRQRAGEIGAFRLAPERIDAGFQQISEMDPLFQESISETKDLTAQQEGVDTVFGTGTAGAKSLRDRVETRTAAFRGGGGALLGEKGFTGLGKAR